MNLYYSVYLAAFIVCTMLTLTAMRVAQTPPEDHGPDRYDPAYVEIKL